MQLGPSGSPRPDVYTLERSYSRPMPTAYEVKISRSDLRSDTTSGKWQKYLAFAGAVIFAVPDGLCTVADIPVGCGLIVRKGATWRHVRKATRQPVTLPTDACMKLLIDGVRRTVQREMPQPRTLDLWREHEEVRNKFGEAVARAARDIVLAQTEATNLQEQRRAGWERVDREVAAHKTMLLNRAKVEMAQFEGAKRQLIEWLGLPEDCSTRAVQMAINELRVSCDADARVRAADDRVSRARSAVDQAARLLAPPLSEVAA